VAYPGLSEAARSIGVELDIGQCRQLESFVGQLEKWNAKFNLLSRSDMKRLWPRHVLDSLSVLPFMPPVDAGHRPLRLLDLGTGAGFPGLPLAIAAPSLEVILVDRNQRKIRFLEMVAAGLGLDNVTACCIDVVRLVDLEPVDVLVSRAVGTPAALWTLGERLLGAAGIMVLMTGVAGQASPISPSVLENPQNTEGFEIAALHRIEIPGLDRAHQVTIIRNR